jgi:hypothetical protein
MPVSTFHGQVATIALRAAAPHGFALGGGNALIAHGIINRATQDVDVFSDVQGGVEAAADAVEAALRDAGFGTERRDKTAGLADIFDGMGEGLAEWIVIAPGGEQMMLQMAYFDRIRRPVIMDVGPVLDLEDVVGGKVCALGLLTELTSRDCRILRHSPPSVARFRAHDLRGRRERSSRAGRPARWGVASDGRSVGTLPAA